MTRSSAKRGKASSVLRVAFCCLGFLCGGAGVVTLGPSQTALAATLPCAATSDHWFACAQSNSGTTTGTGMAINMPATYYCPKPAVTDEAAWLLNKKTLGANNSAIEFGWFQGTWPNGGADSGDYFAGPTAYFTTNDDIPGFHSTWGVVSGTLPSSTNITFDIGGAGGAIADGTSLTAFNTNTGHIYVGKNNQPYYVTTPRTNFSQGEVAFESQPICWMGGNSGTGTTVTGATYQPYGQSYYALWGGYTYESNAPYQFRSINAFLWKNGGPNGI